VYDKHIQNVGRSGKGTQRAIHRAGGKTEQVRLLCHIDTSDEVEHERHGGILPYVLRELLRANYSSAALRKKGAVRRNRAFVVWIPNVTGQAPRQ